MDHFSCNSENFFEKIGKIDINIEFLHLVINTIKDIDKIVNKLLEFDKRIKIDLYLSDLENIPECIFQLVNIYKLDLDIYLKYIPDNICKLVDLEKLDTRCENMIEFPEIIYKLHNLKYLYLGGCNFKKSLNFSSLKKLKELNIYNNFKKSKIEYPLSIEYLGVYNIKISELIKLKNLEYINTHNLIFDKKPIVLCDLQHLKEYSYNHLPFNIIKIQEKRLIYRLLIFLKKLKLFNYKIISKLIKY